MPQARGPAADGKVLRVAGSTHDGPREEMQMGMRLCQSEPDWNAFVDRYMK